MNLPAPWVAHPQSVAHAWNQQTNEVITIDDLRLRVMPVAAPPPTVVGEQPWGEQDMSLPEQDAAAARKGTGFQKGNFIKLEWPEGSTSASMLLRFLPPLRGQKRSYVATPKHRINMQYMVNLKPEMRASAKYDTWTVDCPDAEHPGATCGLCKLLINEVAASSAKDANALFRESRAKNNYAWQALNLSNPTAHIVPIEGPSGTTNMIVPGIFRCGVKLHEALLALFPIGNFTSPDALGFPIEVQRKQTSDGRPPPMNVEYHPIHHAHHKSEIPAELQSVLWNLIDMPKVLPFPTPVEEMEQIADAIRQRLGIGRAAPMAQGQWLPHPHQPGAVYNTVTGAVVAAPTPPAYGAPPAPPVYAPPPAYGAPPAPPPYAAPPAPPAYAPPPPPALPVSPPASAWQAPALPPALPPAGAPALPPAMAPALPPPPMPGMPGGLPF
jgi:hypothetical protein